MVRFERALQIGFGLWLLDSAFAFSTLQTQAGRRVSNGFSSTARSIRRPGGLVVSSEPQQQGLLKDDESKFEKSNLFGQEIVDSVIGDAGSIGQDIILVNLDTATTTPNVDVASAFDQETLVVLSKDLEEETEVSIPTDIPQTIFTYTQANSTDAVSDMAEKSIVLTENVGAILAASEDAMIAAEATLPAEVKKELGSFSNGTDTTVSTFVEDLVDIIPAEEVVGEAVTRSNFDAPPVMTIVKFAIPAVGVWLCSPLLSLIDTSAVGMLSGTVHQAALNPAVAVTDYAALLIAFLYTATTNLVASAQESDRTVPGKPKTTFSMIGAMQLSTYVGLALGATLFVFARPLLKAIIGNDAINPAVFSAAMKYVRIRSLGMPAAAIIGSAQAGCLGCKDIRSPLYVLLAAAVVNFVGDMIFVGCKNPLIGGAAGAAWATVFSQYAALAIFVRWLAKKPEAKNETPKVVDLTKNITDFMGIDKPKGSSPNRRNKLKEFLHLQSKEVELPAKKVKPTTRKITSVFKKLGKKKTSAAVASMPKDEVVSVRGMLAGKFRGRDLLKFPKKPVITSFLPYFAPVTVTQIGRVSGYVAMSHVVSSSLGTISMAAQQVIVSFFYCLTPIADSLSLTAQSFIPAISERKASKERAVALRKTGVNFMKAGGVFGAVMAVAIGLLPIFSGFFTADPAVISLVNSVVPLLIAFFSVHGVLCAAEGVLLGQKDLGFLGKSYGAYFFAVPFFMLRVKRAVLSGVQGINLSSVWTVFLGYQFVRLLMWVSRVEIIQRRTDRVAASVKDAL